jgi:hypothetical protein
MRFPERNLADQYISLSYQDVLQQYVNTGSYRYVLDGYGNVIFGIGTGSIGQIVITSDMTASMTVATASYALTQSYISIIEVSTSFASSSLTASYAHYSETAGAADFALLAGNTLYTSSYALTASYAMNGGGGGGTVIESGSSWNITASVAVTAQSADFALQAGNTLYTSSYALTASYAMNGGGGGGTVIESGSSWNITSSVAISSSYALTASYNLSSGLNIPNYDYSYVTYNGPLGQISDCTYRVGGISGTIVCIVTALYNGEVFIGVSKSLG